MKGRAWSVAVVAVGAMTLAGCSSSASSNPSAAVQSGLSAAASAAKSAANSAANSAVNGLASAASSAVASAEAAASSALASVKGGLDAKGDVTLGAVTTASDGKAEVPVTVKNGQSQSYRYTVQVEFKDQSGNLLDVTVVSVPDVAAGATAQATARSNRTLTSPVAADVAAAVRY